MKNNPYSKIKLKTKFIKNEDCIIFLLKLKSGNLCTCSQDKEINIFDKNYFNLLLSWMGHMNSINCICELNDTHLASCSDDKKISIWEYNIQNKKVIQEIIFFAHESFINKIQLYLYKMEILLLVQRINLYIFGIPAPHMKRNVH